MCEEKVIIPGSQPVDENDNGTIESKTKYLKEKGIDISSTHSVKCSICGKLCCTPCTADGDISRCAVTRFNECSECGHDSKSHKKHSV